MQFGPRSLGLRAPRCRFLGRYPLRESVQRVSRLDQMGGEWDCGRGDYRDEIRERQREGWRCKSAPALSVRLVEPQATFHEDFFPSSVSASFPTSSYARYPATSYVADGLFYCNRYPLRSTYLGSGDSRSLANWACL